MRASIAIAAALTCVAGTAGAADWAFDPKVTLNYRADDNNRLTDVPGEEIKVSGGELDAKLTMRASTPRSTFEMVPRFRGTLYPGDEDEESQEMFLHLDWGFQGERSETTIDANYSQRTVLGRYFPDSEVPDDGELGEPGRGEVIARSTSQNDEERIDVSPSVSFDLNERTALAFVVGGLDVSFDDQVADDRQDFTDAYGAAELHFKMTPARTLSVILEGSRYEPDGGITTDSNSLTLDWTNQATETSKVFLRGGAHRVQSYTAGSEWENGFSGGAGVEWEFEVTRIFVDYNHYVDPSSFGQVVERDQLRFQVDRDLSPVMTIRFAARGILDGGIGNEVFEEREYAAASVKFDWRMSQQFTLGAGYEYSWRQYENQPESGESNAVFIGVTYEPHRL